MRLREIVQFVEGTADPAFAVDGIGNIVAWNHASAETFGISSAEAIGKLCDEVIRGTDDCGELCSSNCVIQQCVGKHQLMHNFDLQIDTQQGKKWFNTSVITVDSTTSTRPYIIHILRLIDIYKRLEMILRDFIVNATNISQKQVTSLILSSKSVFQDAYLTKREIEVLRLVANGKTSKVIAKQLCISSTTVDNHLQHILKKLKSHSRLEAVHRAEHSGLL